MALPTIVIISASVRQGRASHRVALFFERFLRANQLADPLVLDLEAFGFPVFEERLKYLKEPPEGAKQFSEKIRNASGVIIVTPEYNGGYPASLKNVVDLLTDEWRRKPVAISTVSAGAFGGSQVLVGLQFSLWKMQAWTVPAMFPVPEVEKSFNADGLPSDPAKTEARAHKFLSELMWCVTARGRMDEVL